MKLIDSTFEEKLELPVLLLALLLPILTAIVASAV
jgi:hypothetical protein